MFKLYYVTSILCIYLNPLIDNNSLYNILLIKINNIKINFIFVNLVINCLQFVHSSFTYILLSIWILNITNTKYLTISNFYQGYVKIHPNLQYIGSIIYVYATINKKINFKLNKYPLSSIVIISFCLGSLWALFQSVWGYYWSNDSIEYILLIVSYIILIKIHKYYLKKVNNQIIIFLVLFLLVSLRLNLLHTKHNFFSKTSTIKFFIFFLQLSFLQFFLTKTKLKSKLLNLNIIGLSSIIYILYINKLNSFFIKELLSILILYITTKFIFNIYRICNKKLTHLIAYILFYIYILINIKYLLINSQLLDLLRKNTNFFLFVRNNDLILNKQITSYSNLFKSKYLIIKDFNSLQVTKNTLKKLINYF